MIAYDLDGIIVPDLAVTDWQDGVWHTIRCAKLRPVFIPPGVYALITGRPEDDRELTVNWIWKFLRPNLPQVVYHDLPNGLAGNIEAMARWKAKTSPRG